MNITIPYGNRSITALISPERVTSVLKKRIFTRRPAAALIRASLANPLGISLADSLHGMKNVLLVVPDSTRNARLKEILPVILGALDACGAVTDIIVATGLHNPESRDRLRALVGGKIFAQYHVMSHAQHKRQLVSFGTAKGQIPIVLNKILKRYECIVSVGLIEPHLYAGYSGGVKTIAIGLGGERLINATHHPKFLDNRYTGIGNIARNPFQDVLRRIAGKIPLCFSVNIVNDSNGRAAKIFSGVPAQAFAKGVAYARGVYEIAVSKKKDIVICGVGYPKDVNLYQASRAANYIINVSNAILKKGGFLVIVAELKEGFGGGIAEKRFSRAMRRLRSPKTFMRNVRSCGCRAGEHRAYMVAKALCRANIVLVTKNTSSALRSLPFPLFSRVEEALAYIDGVLKKKGSCYVVPHALSTITKCTTRKKLRR